MKNNDADRITPSEGQNRATGGYLGLLRTVALIAVMAGTVGSVGLTLRAGQSTPRLLLVLFVIWVSSPFVALAWASTVSTFWSVLTRATLYCVTLIITLGSLAIYAGVVLPPAGSPRAFIFVAVPIGSWLLMAMAIPVAALISRRERGTSRKPSGADSAQNDNESSTT